MNTVTLSLIYTKHEYMRTVVKIQNFTICHEFFKFTFYKLSINLEKIGIIDVLPYIACFCQNIR